MFSSAWAKAKEAATAATNAVVAAKEAALGPQREIPTPTIVKCDESLSDSEIRVVLQNKVLELGA